MNSQKNLKYLTEYIAKHSDSLFNYACKLTHYNLDDAQDLFQETVYKSLCNAHRYCERNAMGAWLFTIMRNIFINEVKSAFHTTILHADVELLDCIDYESNYDFEYTSQELHAAIDKLSARDREIIMLRLHGKQYDEIATILNMKVGTVKSAINRIKKFLRKRITRQ